MATPRLVSVRDFNTSIYAQLAETSTGNISDVLVAAEQTIERKLKRPIVPTTYTERFVPKTNTIYLRRRPVLAITSFTRSSLPNTLGPTVTQYYLDNEAGVLESVTDIRGYHINITYTAGFVEVPADLKQAILMQAALMAFQDLELYGNGDAKEPGIRYMKENIEEILCPYKQLHLAYTEKYT